MKQFLRFLPLLIGLALLVIAAQFVPWAEVRPYLMALTPVNFGMLLVASLIYYFGRSLRYWMMLRMLGEAIPLRTVIIACLVAQPIAVLPGGELYRGLMLKRYGNVSLKDGTASVFAQALAESLGLSIIAIIGAISIGHYVVITSILSSIFIAIWVVVNIYDGLGALRLLNRLPFINLHHQRLRGYLRRNRILLSGGNFLALLVASLVTTTAGIAIVAIATNALGQPLSLDQAILAYVLPMLFETVSFLPGGLGANEGSSAAILILFGVPLPAAVAITIIVRLSTLGMGFVYGFGAQLVASLAHLKRYPVSDRLG